jgi:BASS family bile acid:Na+ symporter
MILPLVVGMFIRRFAVHYHAMVASNAMRLSVVLLVIFVVAAINSGHIRVVEYGWRPPLALLLLCCISLWLCYGIGALMRISLNDRFTIGVECMVRNVQLGVLLKATLFPPGTSDLIGDGVLYSLLFYGGLCVGVAGFEAFSKRMEIGLLFGAAKRSRLADSTPAEKSD